MNIAYYTQLYKPARKIWFYIRNFASYLVPNAYMRWHGRRLIRSLSATKLDSAMLRADYYCRLPKNCTLANQAIRIGEVSDDYHDLEEKLHYYIAHPEAAEAIISHAHDYIRTFLDKRQEAAVQWLTAQRYFERTGQQALLGTNYRIDR